MRKPVVSLVLVALLGSLLMGCATLLPDKGRAIENRMRAKARRVIAAGGLAAVGRGESRDEAMATKKAQNDGRVELANALEARVNSLRKDFGEEIGKSDAAEYNTLFSDASKTVVSAVVRGTAAPDVDYITKGGMTRAWALITVSPKLVKDHFAQLNNPRWDRFRASQAFKNLDDEVKRYEEFLKADAAAGN